MKFIELYNRNKNTPVFKEKLRIFKAWTRLAKNQPNKYKVEFNNSLGYFEYFERKRIFSYGEAYWEWVNKGNSLCGYCKFTEMYHFEK